MINEFIKKLIWLATKNIFLPILSDIKRMGYVLFFIYDFVIVSYIYLYKDTLYNFYKNYLNLKYLNYIKNKIIEFCKDDPVPTTKTILNSIILQDVSHNVIKNASKKEANDLIEKLYKIITKK